jgi:predicted RNA-binding protein YlqC (UPF0109 family)
MHRAAKASSERNHDQEDLDGRRREIYSPTHPEDIGEIIGKGGRAARSIRNIILGVEARLDEC